jgi:hypothetical protein
MAGASMTHTLAGSGYHPLAEIITIIGSPDGLRARRPSGHRALLISA